MNNGTSSDDESGVEDDSPPLPRQQNPLLALSIPNFIADKIWAQTKQLRAIDDSVCRSPGCADGKTWLVQSMDSARKRPYFVECKANGDISCEQGCMLYNSCRVCAHTVTVAQHKDCLDDLITCLVKNQSNVSVSKMAGVGMPKGPGKKPNRRKASKKASTKRVRDILENAGDAIRSPRIDVATESVSTDEREFLCEEGVHDFVEPSRSAPYSSTSHLHEPSSSHFSHLPGPSSFNFSPRQVPHLPERSSSHFSPNQVPHLPEPSSRHSPHLPEPSSRYSPHLPESSSSHFSYSLPPPPPLVRSTSQPLQVAMPFMYAPMYMTAGRPDVSVQQPLQSQSNKGVGNPLILMFVRGNITRCVGCGSRDLRNSSGKPHDPPGDLCLQHKEFVTFNNPRTGLPQQSHDLRNVYYHARRTCIHKFGEQVKIVVSSDVRKKLFTVHINYIMTELGLNILNNSY